MGYHTHDTITRTHKSIKAMAISRNNRHRLTKTPKTSTLPLFSGDAAVALFRSSRWGLCTADLILVFTGRKSFFVNKKKVTRALVWADLALFRVAIALNQHLPQGIVLWLQKQSWSWALRMCWMPYGMESKKSGLSAFIYARKLSLEKHVGDFFFFLNDMKVGQKHGLKWSGITCEHPTTYFYFLYMKHIALHFTGR